MSVRDQAGLTYPQVFLLVIGFAVASGLIFLFGIWVGIDINERRLAQEERVVRQSAPVQPTVPQVEPKEEVDRAFYERLKEKAAQRFEATAVPPPSPTAAKTISAPIFPAAAGERTTAIERPTVAATATARPKRTEPPIVDNMWADAGWTVQVNATTDMNQATELARQLNAKGYDAYTVQAPMRGQTWYRVRVGRFSSREKAKEVEERLKLDEGMENAYVAPQ